MKIMIRIVFTVLAFGFAGRVLSHPTRVPPEYIDELIKRYVEAETALNEADLETVQRKGLRISRMFNLDPGEKAHEAFPELRRYAHRMSKATDLERARFDFNRVSVMVKYTLSSTGYFNHSDLRVFKCESALDGSGGVWLQASSDPDSPYCFDDRTCDISEIHKPFSFVKHKKIKK